MEMDARRTTNSDEPSLSLAHSILTVLLQWTSVDGKESESTRQSIIALAARLRLQLPQIHLEATASSVDAAKEECDMLASQSIEQVMTELRRQLPRYQQCLAENQADLLSFQTDLESLALSPRMPLSSLSLELALSIRRMIQHQVHCEARMVRSLASSLDTIYSDSSRSQGDLVHLLERLSSVLSRRELQEQLEYHAANAVIHGMQGDDRNGAVARVGSLAIATTTTTTVLDHVHGDTDRVESLDSSRTRFNQAIVNATSIRNVADIFIDAHHATQSANMDRMFAMVYVMGDAGSGKTFLCSAIEQKFNSAGMLVIRPRIPLDFLGSSVGDAEDCLISILGAITSSTCPTVVLLDDIHLLLLQGHGQEDSHAACRTQATLLHMIDILEQQAAGKHSVLVVGFAHTIAEALSCRCDLILRINPPDQIERRAWLTTQLAFPSPASMSNHEDKVQKLLSSIVEATVGKFYAELNQLCRQAYETTAAARENQLDGALERLQALDARLSALVPASLQNGLNDDMIDMRVLTSSDLLLSASGSNIAGDDELRGDSAKLAWRDMVGSVVLPLCRSRELNELMYASSSKSSQQKLMSGGVLLTGEPMSGKTFIAYRCCRYAATMKSSVRVLDVSCTSLIHKEVGGSERAVRRLFECARKAAPCIIIMDAIENVAAVRGHDTTTEGTLDRVLSTLLVELDGVDDHGSSIDGGIAVIGITHDSALVDSALLRPGRLGKIIEMRKDW